MRVGINVFPSLFTHQFSEDVLLLHAPCEILGTNKRQHVDRYTPGYGSGKRVFQYHVNVYEIIVHMYVYFWAHIKLGTFLRAQVRAHLLLMMKDAAVFRP